MSRTNVCPNCGKTGPHFVPPCSGDKGFFTCKKKGEEIKKFEVYFCPICGRTVTHEVNPDTLPSITCGPHMDEVKGEFMVYMAQIFPRERSTISKELTEKLQHLIDQSKVITAQGIVSFLEEKEALEADPAGKLNMSEITTSHKERHIFLHRILDELLADFIDHTTKLPSKATLLDFLDWLYQQTKEPTEKQT